MALVPALVLGLVLILATVMFWLARRDAAARVAKEEALASDARRRGWRFEASDEGVFRLHRWQGTTDGITWTAEHRRRARKQQGGAHQRPHRFVWWADTLRGPSSPLLFMGVTPGKEAPAARVAQGDGMLARLAQKAAGFAFDQAIDVYFGTDTGSQVNAGDLRTLEGTALPGYIVMATDVPEGQRQVSNGWADAIEHETRTNGSALSDTDRPWLLLLPRRVSLARTSPISGPADVERFAVAGARLVKRT